MQEQNLTAEQMLGNVKRGWFHAMLPIILSGVISFFMQRAMSSDAGGAPFFSADEATILVAAASVAIVILVAGAILKARSIRLSVENQDAQLVIKGYVIALRSAALITSLGVILAIGFWYPRFYVWHIFALVSLLIHFPRLRPFLNATYKQTL